MFPSKTAHSVAQSLSQPFKDSIPMTTFISGEFLNMTETSFVLYDPCVVCLVSSLKKKIMELLKLLEAWWRSSGGRPASAKSVQLLHFHPLPSSNNNETFTFLCAVGVFHFSSMRILSSTRINKVEVKVWGRMFFCESPRVQFRCFHHIFPAIRRKVSRFRWNMTPRVENNCTLSVFD